MDQAAPVVDEGDKVSGEPEDVKKEQGPPDAENGKAEGDGHTGEGEAPPSEKKSKTLDQMMSLKEGDDERTQISKKISWILRHGAQKVDIAIDTDGWVTFENLLASSIMAGVTEDKLMDVIDESNSLKVRYELKEPEEGEDGKEGKAVRAVSKQTISGMAGTLAREQRKAERREARQERKEQERNGQLQGEPLSGDTPAADSAEQSGGWGRAGFGSANQESPSFEQQLKDGYKPIYQGNRVVAMVNADGHTVDPGARMKGDYKGDYKGKGYGKDRVDRYGSGYGGYGGYGNGGGYGGYGGEERGKGDFAPQRWGGGGKGGYWEYGDTDRDYGKHGGKGYKDSGDSRRDFGKHGGGAKGYNDSRDSGRHYGKHGGPGAKGGYNDSHYDHIQPQSYESAQRYWRVCSGQQAIMRETEAMESKAIITLPAGTLVLQTGADSTNQYGIVRMPVETVDDRFRGWVTRTAEAAQGPAFFKPDSGPGKSSDSKGSGKGKRGKSGKGKGDMQDLWDSGTGQGRFENGRFTDD